jgi:hypothetical protein
MLSEADTNSWRSHTGENRALTAGHALRPAAILDRDDRAIGNAAPSEAAHSPSAVPHVSVRIQDFKKRCTRPEAGA